jgi:glycosyltransferase involved in cell wall biosynthesis
MGVGDESSRPTVLVVTHNYIRDLEDQAGQFIHTLIKPIVDRYRFIVIAPHAAGLAERESIEGIEVARFRYGPDEAETLAYAGNMHEQVFRSWGKRLTFLRFLRAMRGATAQAVEVEHPVAVHIHWWVPGALAAAGVIARRRVPYILTTHGSDVTLLDRFAWLRPVGRVLFRRAAARTAVSTYLKGRLKALVGVDAHVLPMPYDDGKFRPLPGPDREPPRVTCIGRFIERKGQRYLFRAIALLKERGLEVNVQLVGDGPQRAALEALGAELGIRDRIVWRGNIPHRDIPAVIGESAVVVLPSVRDWKGEVEGLGMVLVEASACGRPVIGTRLAGIKDAIADGQSGILVEPADAVALADALERVLRDPELARRLGEGGVEFAREHFSPAGQAGKLAAIIEALRSP